jgi:hypothetical protein
MDNIYSLVAELLISNASGNADRSMFLCRGLYQEALALNAIVEQVVNAAIKLQPFTEKESTSLN